MAIMQPTLSNRIRNTCSANEKAHAKRFESGVLSKYLVARRRHNLFQEQKKKKQTAETGFSTVVLLWFDVKFLILICNTLFGVGNGFEEKLSEIGFERTTCQTQGDQEFISFPFNFKLD